MEESPADGGMEAGSVQGEEEGGRGRRGRQEGASVALILTRHSSVRDEVSC